MTGVIYKITCLINNKIYIGQTIQHYLDRFTQHKSHAKTGQSNHKLARAIRKYGAENFDIEVIEECDQNLLDNKEKYWINYYNSADDSYGYNTSLGGKDSTNYYQLDNEKEIIDYYLQCHNQTQTFQHFGITEYKFRQILTKNNIPTDYTNYGKHTRQAIRIVELDLIFNSEKECAKYFIDNNICSTKKLQCAVVRVNYGLTNNKKVYGYTLERL